MAEGAGALVLESYEHAKARGAKILGVIEGCGEMADAFHRTRSSPDGKPIIGCIAQRASRTPGLTPDDIDYVNAHGTGTPENDKMECLGVDGRVRRAREGRADLVQQVDDRPYAVGGRRGRGGVHAADACSTSASRRPSITTCRIPAIPLDVVPNKARDAKVRHAISNSFGFGGQNVSLVMGLRAGVNAAASTMRALRLVADRKLELADVPAPPPPGAGEVQIAIKAVALNHLDLWGFRGMAFAKRKMPLVVGAEAAGEIAAVGARRHAASSPATRS